MKKAEGKRVAERFRRSLESYDREAVVQREVGAHLVSLLDRCSGLRTGRVLDIGCCTGSVTAMVCTARPVTTLFLNDLVEECCGFAARRLARLATAIETIPGDIESTTLPRELDLVISSSTFQWMRDLPGCIDRIRTALASSGYLACSLFGPGTMAQFRELTGVGLDYLASNRLATLLDPGFEIVHIESQLRTVWFASPREVLRHIQLTGVGGVGEFCWTPRRLRDFERRYRQRYGSRRGVPLDYAPIFFIARKRD